MQRAAFPELQGQPRPARHRRAERPDRVLLGLKIATVTAAASLVGVIILLTSDHDEVAAPFPPTVASGGSADDAPRYAPAETTRPTLAEPPALRTETSRITGRPAPTSRRPRPALAPTSAPAPRPRITFAAIGQPCPEPGRWSVTRDYELVVCASSQPGTQPRWQRLL